MEFKRLCELDNLDELIKEGLSVGMEYQEIMNLNPLQFEKVYIGKIAMLERMLNDTNLLNRIQAIKIAQSFLDGKGFNKNNKPIRLLKETTEEQAARIANNDGIKPEVIRENILRG